MKAVAWAIVIGAFILGAFYYESVGRRAEAEVTRACIEGGGSFHVTWNWKQVCELKR